MIFTSVILLLAIFWIALLAMQHYAGQLIISPIMGIMFGALTFTWETNE